MARRRAPYRSFLHDPLPCPPPFLLFNLQDLREEGRGKEKISILSGGRARRDEDGSIDRHVSSVKNRDADTSLVFLSCHRTTRSYIFQRQTFPTIPLHSRVYRVYRSLLTSDRCGDPRVQVSSIVTGVDTVSLLLDDLSSLRDPRLLLSAAKHNRHVSHLRAPLLFLPPYQLLSSSLFFLLLISMNYDPSSKIDVSPPTR